MQLSIMEHPKTQSSDEPSQLEDSNQQGAGCDSSSMILLNELSDPDQEIYIQLGKNTDTFTCFPSLPIEIRLKIWRSSFPSPRAINLLPRCQGYCRHEHGFFPDRYHNVTVRKCRVPLPITLRINCESRQETLMHNILVLRNGTCQPRSDRVETKVRLDNGPFSFEPSRDVAFVYFCCFLFRNQQRKGLDLDSDWIVRPEQRENVKRISRLEIRRMHWSRLLRKIMRIYNSRDLSWFESNLGLTSRERWDHKGPFGGLLQFPGLREIHATLQFSNVIEKNRLGNPEEACAECETELLKFLENHKAVFGGGIPTVTVSFCTPLFHELPYGTF